MATSYHSSAYLKMENSLERAVPLICGGVMSVVTYGLGVAAYDSDTLIGKVALGTATVLSAATAAVLFIQAARK